MTCEKAGTRHKDNMYMYVLAVMYIHIHGMYQRETLPAFREMKRLMVRMIKEMFTNTQPHISDGALHRLSTLPHAQTESLHLSFQSY